MRDQNYDQDDDDDYTRFDNNDNEVVDAQGT